MKICFAVLLQQYISIYFQRMDLVLFILPQPSQVKRHDATALQRGFHPQSWHKLNTGTGYLWEYSYGFLTTCEFAPSVKWFSPKANTYRCEKLVAIQDLICYSEFFPSKISTDGICVIRTSISLHRPPK